MSEKEIIKLNYKIMVRGKLTDRELEIINHPQSPYEYLTACHYHKYVTGDRQLAKDMFDLYRLMSTREELNNGSALTYLMSC